MIAPIHQRLMNGYESQSRYDGYCRGPDVSKLLACTAFKPLESTNQDDVINWYDKFAYVAEPYQIALVPFAQIEMKHGPYMAYAQKVLAQVNSMISVEQWHSC
jgi:hypothetical protein